MFSDEENPFILDEVAELARKVGYKAQLSGGTLTVRRKTPKMI